MNAGLLIATLVPSTSLLIATAMLMYTRRQTHVEERDDARDEARQLAEVRGEAIDDLRQHIDTLHAEIVKQKEKAESELASLRETIELVRDESADLQRALAVGFRGTLLKLLGHLEADPIEVRAAIRYLREMLNGDAPPYPRQRRAAAEEAA